MDVGQVGFKVSKGSLDIIKEVVKVRDIEKDKDVLKRITKTQDEKFPDLEAMRLERNARENKIKKEKMKAEAKEKDLRDMEH